MRVLTPSACSTLSNFPLGPCLPLPCPCSTGGLARLAYLNWYSAPSLKPVAMAMGVEFTKYLIAPCGSFTKIARSEDGRVLYSLHTDESFSLFPRRNFNFALKAFLHCLGKPMAWMHSLPILRVVYLCDAVVGVCPSLLLDWCFLIRASAKCMLHQGSVNVALVITTPYCIAAPPRSAKNAVSHRARAANARQRAHKPRRCVAS